MTIKRLDHVSVVVDDLAAAIALFTGMTIEDETPVEGSWVDRVNGLEPITSSTGSERRSRFSS
jgi:hypothetical protein